MKTGSGNGAETTSARTFALVLAAVALLSLLGRIGYVAGQAAVDPTFSAPVLDGAYYLERAREIREGSGGEVGAFYLAPLYGYLLAGFLAAFGERFALLYLLQHAAVVAAACLLALAGRRLVGPVAGLAAGALLLLYHPALFFASRPVGESTALFLLCAALYAASRGAPAWSGAGGLLAGAAALARPNLLLVPVAWAGAGVGRRRWMAALLTLVGATVAILPVTLSNALRSGHLVPISSNGGMTLYHGNAPGAEGTFTWSRGFSGDPGAQESEATRFASALAGRTLDAVEADRYWGRRAVSARADEPVGTAVLAGRKLALSVANAEIPLDYAPSLDDNPWRHLAPVPFAVVFALAGTALVFRGREGSGGWTAWGAVLACAAAPWIFYVSSRYRLPAVAMLCIPAGAGVALVAESLRRGSAGRRRLAVLATAFGLAFASVVLPAGPVARGAEASALASRAVAWKRAGDPGRGMRDLEAALERDPRSVAAWFNLGVLQEEADLPARAEESYRRALELYRGHPESAGNLSALLIRDGRPGEGIPALLDALEVRPFDLNCWTNLVVALVLTGEIDSARSAAAAAAAEGVSLDPPLLDALAGAPPVTPSGTEP
jgi:tetratricopeptide (TPR) repeat protein